MNFADQIAAANPLGTQDPNRSDADSTTKTLQELQAEARRNEMQARTLQKSGAKTPATGSASFQVAIVKGAPRQITVYLAPMTSNGSRTEASKILANATRAFLEDIAMTGKSRLTHCYFRHDNSVCLKMQ